jgi:hypothetical protein
MRIQKVGDADIQIPHEVSFSSHCLSPSDANSIQFSVPLKSEDRMGGGRRTIVIYERPVLSPRWIRWDVYGHDITFQDVNGGRAVFKFDNESSWTAQISQAGYPPITLRLEPKKRFGVRFGSKSASPGCVRRGRSTPESRHPGRPLP